MQKYDYIIVGTGASGLMLAYHMVMDSFFDQKQILLIDKEVKDKNDRSWCFWEKENGIWDTVVHKKWSHIFFNSESYSNHASIFPYTYKLIKSKDFYEFVFTVLKEKSNVTIVHEKLINIIDEGTIVEVETDKQIHLSSKVFSSVLVSNDYKNQSKYPLLNQHFIGWFIKTETPVFDSDTATFMDFKIAQKGNTRFMYILPISKTEALLEYTLFSENLLEDQEYEDEISKYLNTKGIKKYTITHRERGCIPMTCYEFRKQNSKNVLYIGSAGGWTKPSTGYTFQASSKKVEKLLLFLKKRKALSSFEKRTRYWYYDLLFLDVLYTKNQKGTTLFSRLFRKNKVVRVLKFLDEETSFIEDLRIIWSMPSREFLKMIWKRIVKFCSNKK